MKITDQHPTVSKTYASVWLKHFNIGRKWYKFKFIDDLKFVKKKYLPLYTNVGGKIAVGASYQLSDNEETDFKNRTFLIYDVPSYFDLPSEFSKTNLEIKKLKDNIAYLNNKFSQYETFQEFIKDNLNSKMIREVRRRTRKLEQEFDIDYQWYFGHISKTDYNNIFNRFFELLEKKYKTKKQSFRHISQKNWQFYHSLIYPLINEKKASLFVMKADGIPVSIELSFNSNNIMYTSMPAEDISFYKYGLGKIRLLKQFEFCFNNKINIIDLKKGNYGYKEKWCNKTYYFEHHVLYDKSSLIARIIKDVLVFKYNFKTKLSSSKANILRHKLQYKLKSTFNS